MAEPDQPEMRTVLIVMYADDEVWISRTNLCEILTLLAAKHLGDENPDIPETYLSIVQNLQNIPAIPQGGDT